jgi:hypothetical protein
VLYCGEMRKQHEKHFQFLICVEWIYCNNLFILL